ncbi:hypothetical protein TGDOM2_398400 [Toxoplasma gondii GAB2-2007-GAL-DOM2]|uniref:Transmembrane protein n=1 Tax=Toxoplasma gondii GAB2-2007-GAL-DOM2 TaxID=1130820 RepID=A0A086KJW1_TOXGO|nr:hypothetical protein TGDOM2_398400 [Toxoplasma gondii GAB2-2007-GAL-DOM2]
MLSALLLSAYLLLPAGESSAESRTFSVSRRMDGHSPKEGNSRSVDTGVEMMEHTRGHVPSTDIKT